MVKAWSLPNGYPSGPLSSTEVPAEDQQQKEHIEDLESLAISGTDFVEVVTYTGCVCIFKYIYIHIYIYIYVYTYIYIYM